MKVQHIRAAPLTHSYLAVFFNIYPFDWERAWYMLNTMSLLRSFDFMPYEQDQPSARMHPHYNAIAPQIEPSPL